MNLLTVSKVSMSYAEKKLFQQITLGINQGDKIGIIGVNGCGKSTLLKIAAGVIVPEEGTVIKEGSVTIEYLPQMPVFDENLSILENVTRGKKASEDYWNLEGEAKSMLQKMGIENLDLSPDKLSGGQKKRAALVRALLTPAQILILDEPTNHLDQEMTEWLEEYLKKWRGAFLMVTHDRYFLDRVSNCIVELDNSTLYRYEANYSKFLELKAQREEMEVATERKNKSLYKKDLEWMMRGARARSTKQKAHIQRFEALRDREKPKEDKQVELNSLSSRLGRSTVELNSISKSYGDLKLFEDFTYIFLKKDRIGIVGKNGCGKSTLLKVLQGNLPVDSGEISIGETVKIGYFSQENEDLNESLRVIDYVKEIAEYLETDSGKATASQMCERFLFDSKMQYSYISKLSGGEKRRLYLLSVLMKAPNILILDEPTNDLDIPTLMILEEYLEKFSGIVITVSHDRYFLDRVVSRILSFEKDGKIYQYEGGYTDFTEAYSRKNTEEPEPVAVVEKPSAKGKTNDSKPKKLSYNQQREYDSIEGVIQKLEADLEELDKLMEENASNYGKLHIWMEEKEQKELELEEKMERWMELQELVEEIEG